MLQSCSIGVTAWEAQSKLKLNSSKTEFLLMGSKSQREKFINHFPLAVLDNEMNPADSARNLGVFFDSGLNFRQHISQVFSSCFYHIRRIRIVSDVSVSSFSKTNCSGTGDKQTGLL